jgi:predicted nucleic acid-binding protein
VSGFLLDTNSISELIRPRADPGVTEWMRAADDALLYVSVLTLGEIRKGAAALDDGKKGSRIESWLEEELKIFFAGRILSVDEAVADRWGQLAARAKRIGRPLAIIDGLLAATALHYNLTVVSRNAGDFQNAEVPVLNPWLA